MRILLAHVEMRILPALSSLFLCAVTQLQIMTTLGSLSAFYHTFSLKSQRLWLLTLQKEKKPEG